MTALTSILALALAAAAQQGDKLEEARNRQDRYYLEQTVRNRKAAAEKNPHDAAALYGLAQAQSYLAEVTLELKDKDAATNAAEDGIHAAERAVELQPKVAEYHRILGTLCGQIIPAHVLLGLKYGGCARSSIDKAIELDPKSSKAYLSRGIGNYYLPAGMGGGVELAIRDFEKAIHSIPIRPTHTCGLASLFGSCIAMPTRVGDREIHRAEPRPSVGEAATRKDARAVKPDSSRRTPLFVGAAIVLLTLLGFFQFPGHTFLQADTQIYVPILEHFRDHTVFDRDLIARDPHVAFTIYDEVALGLRRITGLDFQAVLTAQQLVFRALGLLGIYLIATSMGLRARLALLVTAIFSLGATIGGRPC